MSPENLEISLRKRVCAPKCLLLKCLPTLLLCTCPITLRDFDFEASLQNSGHGTTAFRRRYT